MDDSVSRYGKSQFEFETLGETEIDEAVSDSREQLLTVVSVVMMEEIGVETEAELEGTFELLVTLLPPFEIVIFKLVIVVEFCVVVDVVLDAGFEKMSLLLSGSKADWDERLNTEPQSMLLVLPLSTSSTSPNAESASLKLFCEANDEMPGDGNGVALPLDGSFSG